MTAMNLVKTFCAAAALGLSAMAANAAVIDFTSASSSAADEQTSFSGSTGSISWTLTAIGGTFEVSEAGPGSLSLGNGGSLDGVFDGIGIEDDEVTFPEEEVVLTFNTTVELSAAYFLDLFEPEMVTISSNSGQSIIVTSGVPLSDGVGFNEFTGLLLTGSVFTFTPDSPNEVGGPDFALAGIEASNIPLPAGILLLGGALLGLRSFGRRA